MRCLRRIININWDDVRDLRITNDQVRKIFKDNDTIDNIIVKK